MSMGPSVPCLQRAVVLDGGAHGLGLKGFIGL